MIEASPLEQAARLPGEAAPPRTMRRWLRGSFLAATTIALAIGVWLYVLPPQLGGSTDYAVIDGSSMQPKLHATDLVLLRPSGTYRVGDVVGYRSQLLHRVVLHRIVAVHGGHYVFKGDNNSFLDPERPTRDRLVGRLWVHVGGAGRLVQTLHRPFVAALVAGLLVLALGLGDRRRRTADA